MSLFENKRAFTLTTIFAFAFAGCATYGFLQRSALQDTVKKINEADSKMEKIVKSPLPAKAETRELLNKQTTAIQRSLRPLEEDLSVYAKTCKALTEDAIKKETNFKPDFLKKARASFVEMANAAGCRLDDPEGFTFGLDRNYNERNDAATTTTTPYLLYQLAAAKTLAGYVVNAGAVSLDRMYCEAVPNTEAEEETTPLLIELSFTVKRGEIPVGQEYTAPVTQVLNSILEGKGSNEKEKFFFIIRGINMMSNNTYGSVDPYSDPFANNAEGPTTIADRKVGKPEETIRVNLIVEAVYFS